jgi:hypothetical protein
LTTRLAAGSPRRVTVCLPRLSGAENVTRNLMSSETVPPWPPWGDCG